MRQTLAARYRTSTIVASQDHFAGHGMAKGKGGFQGKNAKGGQPGQFPQVKRPMPPSVPRIMPRTKASPKGR